MAKESVYAQITHLFHEINGLIAALDIDILGKETAKNNVLIRQLVADARLDIRDCEMADSRVEMEKTAKIAIKRLDRLRAAILFGSEHGIFSAIDVAQLSARIDVIVADLG